MKKIENSECLVDFGNYIKEARKWRNINQKEIAEELGISQAYYSMIERGEREVDLVLAIDICRVLHLDMRDYIKKYL